MSNVKLSYETKPEVIHPINAIGGLYTSVLASNRTDAETLLAFVRDDVEKAGYDPDGRGCVGMPCEYGIVSRTYAMWFYQKRRI